MRCAGLISTLITFNECIIIKLPYNQLMGMCTPVCPVPPALYMASVHPWSSPRDWDSIHVASMKGQDPILTHRPTSFTSSADITWSMLLTPVWFVISSKPLRTLSVISDRYCIIVSYPPVPVLLWRQLAGLYVIKSHYFRRDSTTPTCYKHDVEPIPNLNLFSLHVLCHSKSSTCTGYMFTEVFWCYIFQLSICNIFHLLALYMWSL